MAIHTRQKEEVLEGVTDAELRSLQPRGSRTREMMTGHSSSTFPTPGRLAAARPDSGHF